jgi:PAS domain S-box-containing protein
MINLEAAWEAIINKAGCPVVVTDALAKDNPIVFVNACFEELSGYRKEDVIGQNPRLLHGLEDKQPGLNELREAIYTRRPCRVALRDYRKDGQPYWVEASVSPIFDKAGRLTHFIGIQQDITRLVEQTSQREEFISELSREVSRQEERSRMIIDQALDAFVSLDEHGRITDWNETAQLIFGWKREAVLGQDFADLFIPQRARTQFRKEQLGETSEAGGVRTDLTVINRFGREIPVEMSVFPIEFHQQKNYCAFIQDISARKDAEQRIKEFYALLSHELRSPLTSIRGALGLIEGGMVGDIPSEAAEMVKVARESSEHLMGLVDDILDLKKIEAGKFELQIDRVDLSSLATDAVQTLSGMAENQKVILEFRTPDSEACVMADRRRLLQVLANLISNAIKFSPENGKVEIRLVNLSDYWRVEVVDQGPGISAENQLKLFDKFKQLQSPDRKQRAGTGLGLAISKALVEQHHGRIGLTSEVAEGSTFWFELPEIKKPEGCEQFK